MKKEQYTKKGLKPLTIYLAPDYMETLDREARDNRRSRKAQVELLLETHCIDYKKKEVRNVVG